MGSVVSNLFGSSSGPKTGGVGGIDDLKNGLIEQSNELLAGIGPNRAAREATVSSFTQALADQALGRGPSFTGELLKRNNDRNLSQQLAMVKANRAVNPALALKQSQRLGADMAQRTAQDAALMKLQERNQAQGQFANFLGQQNQLAAQSRTAALGGAQAAQNINAADAARGDRMFGALLDAGASAGAAIAGAPGKHKGGLIKGYSNGGEVLDASMFAKPAGSYSFSEAIQGLQGPGRILNVAAGESYGEMDPNSGKNFGKALQAMFAQKLPNAVPFAGGPMDTRGTQIDSQVLLPVYASQGAMVPGKASVAGDSPKNDTVPAMLSPGEMVVPRSVVEEGPKAIKSFAQAVLNSKKPSQKKNKEPAGFGAVLAAQADFNRRIEEIQKKFGPKK